MDRRISRNLRKQIFERDNYTCRYCGATNVKLVIDHVYPYSKGGETSIGNLVASCESCNYSKRDHLGTYPVPVGYLEEKKDLHELKSRLSRPLSILSGIAMCIGCLLFVYGYNQAEFELRYTIYFIAIILTVAGIFFEFGWESR